MDRHGNLNIYNYFALLAKFIFKKFKDPIKLIKFYFKKFTQKTSTGKCKSYSNLSKGYMRRMIQIILTSSAPNLNVMLAVDLIFLLFSVAFCLILYATQYT